MGNYILIKRDDIETGHDRLALTRARIIFGSLGRFEAWAREWEEMRIDLLKKLPKDHDIYITSEEG